MAFHAKPFRRRYGILLALSAAWPSVGWSAAHAVEARDEAQALQLDEIIVTGTRRSDQKASDSLSPIDLIGSKYLETVPSSDLNDKLARLVPSYQVQRNTVADGNIFFRAATLRNLSPDQTLVLVNGKRRHRSAFIDVTQLGAQAVDVAQIPSVALKQVEVLRDGASAQYGSDAIAGVINFILEDRPGIRAYTQVGQYYAGDGTNYQAGVNAGLPLTDRGQINLSFEYTNSDRTARNDQNPAARALATNGGQYGNAAFYNGALRDPVQRIGQPEQENYRSFVNASFDLADNLNLYSFASHSSSKGESDFVWRNPETTGFFNPLPVWGNWTLRSVYPGGFTPNFRASSKDTDVVTGLKGELADDLAWDLSVRYGRNEIRYNIDNTVNASLGPASPTRFYAGSRTQSEYGTNLDLTWRPEVGLAEPLTVAFGGEYRHEQYRVGTGETAAYALGPGAAFGYPGGSNGFFGTDPTQAGKFGRHSVAAYVDVDAQISDALEIDAAGRFEDYADAGSAATGKIAGRYRLTNQLALRGTLSTGFRAPTPGQANLTNTSQQPSPSGTTILTRGTIPSINPVAVLRGGTPLEPERSLNLSGGLTYALSSQANLTFDYYNIRVKDRLGLSGNYTLSAAERANLLASGVTLAQGLDTFNFYVNGFTTRTQGVDAVFSYQLPIDADTTINATALYNYNQTEITKSKPGVISPLRQQALEDRLPRHKASLTIDASYRQLQATLRGT
ncbi:TonB-dependent receptor [Niveispirillum sp. BGYR6]|uniref:TonB-dependent receptor plug domain-containing protein n=1 Tax=Niveispirillum sp. BGYR6 TaxID=2971249 RepID=UPI0022B962AF|nr:TonB-dependent receptor [Niveispirillum sp. BGYR6]MDG5497516.1 TonB-dependent receptor [Niveispirillum sp. BGYR6]